MRRWSGRSARVRPSKLVRFSPNNRRDLNLKTFDTRDFDVFSNQK